MMNSLASGPSVSYSETVHSDWEMSPRSGPERARCQPRARRRRSFPPKELFLTNKLPLGPVLGPQAHAVLVGGDAGAVVDLDDAGADVLPPLGRLAVAHPDVAVLPLAGGRVPRPPAQHAAVAALAHRELEEVVERLVGRVDGLEQRHVAEAPVAVHGRPVRPLRPGDGQRVRRSGRRRRRELGHHGRNLGRRHSACGARRLFFRQASPAADSAGPCAAASVRGGGGELSPACRLVCQRLCLSGWHAGLHGDIAQQLMRPASDPRTRLSNCRAEAAPGRAATRARRGRSERGRGRRRRRQARRRGRRHMLSVAGGDKARAQRAVACVSAGTFPAMYSVMYARSQAPSTPPCCYRGQLGPAQADGRPLKWAAD